MQKRDNLFLNFLQQDYFYNKFYDSIKWFFIGNKELIMARKSDRINYITEIEDLELDFKYVWIEDKEGTLIDFDVTISVDVNFTASYGKYRDRDSDNANNIWINVLCSGDLNNKFEKFRIIGVEEYVKSKPKKPLSGDFVPIISKKQYNDYAEDILEKYYPEALLKPMKIDPYILAKNMGLKTCETKITEDGSIFGLLFFADSQATLYNKKSFQFEPVKVPAKTIVVDPEANFLRSIGSSNLTVAHECIHYVLHKKAFLFAQIFEESLSFIQCEVNGGLRGFNSITSMEWMELQANAIAPHLLMPTKTFKVKLNELYQEYSINDNFNPLDYIERIISDLADFFGVTTYAARKKMIDIGYKTAQGALNWIDGIYIRPYKTKELNIKNDETYTISYKDVLSVLYNNAKIVEGLMHGVYVFVENHVCINDTKYIEFDLFNNIQLTEYARNNIDECCIKFKFYTESIKQDAGFAYFCYLNRDCNEGFKFTLDLPTDGNDKVLGNAELAKRFSKRTENIAKMQKIAGMTFTEALNYLIEFVGMDTGALVCRTGLDERTIRRYIKGEIKKPTKTSVVAICRGLKIPIIISKLLLDRAGLALIAGDKYDDAYELILTVMLENDIVSVNKFLRDIGVPPLSEEQ